MHSAVAAAAAAAAFLCDNQKSRKQCSVLKEWNYSVYCQYLDLLVFIFCNTESAFFTVNQEDV